MQLAPRWYYWGAWSDYHPGNMGGFSTFGEGNMTIGEAIRDINAFGEEDILFGIPTASEWQENDECLAISEPIDVTIIERDGKTYRYFLEMETIREVIEGWENIRSRRVSEEENIRVVIYYAMYDSWPAP